MTPIAVVREIWTVHRRLKGTPLSACNRDPLLVFGMNVTTEPLARVGALGGPSLTGGSTPAWRSSWWGQLRCLKRQLSLPVSMMSQWWVMRSSSAVVILGSPNTVGHSPNARLVVTITEVRS